MSNKKNFGNEVSSQEELDSLTEAFLKKGGAIIKVTQSKEDTARSIKGHGKDFFRNTMAFAKRDA